MAIVAKGNAARLTVRYRRQSPRFGKDDAKSERSAIDQLRIFSSSDRLSCNIYAQIPPICGGDMSLSKTLRVLLLGLISLLGLLILVGVAAWWHNWAYGTLNPDKVQPTEDWTLGLGFGMIAIQLAVAVEVVLIGLVTWFRWLNFNRARNAIGLFSLILLAFALPGLRGAASATPESLGAGLLYLLYLILPVVPAWGLLYCRRTQRPVEK